MHHEHNQTEQDADKKFAFICQSWQEYSGQSDFSLLRKAYDFAKLAHKDQKRATGEPYIVHPVAAAEILLDLEVDQDTLIAALLHDTVEDTEVSLSEIEESFGTDVANLVDGVTKLSKFSYSTQEEIQAENYRKMFLAMARDIRVVLIKLADRLHNMRTMDYKNDSKQIDKSRESLDIYAPLAHRLGIHKIKWELEDLSLRYLDPDAYYGLVDQIAAKRSDRENFLTETTRDLDNRISKMGIKADIEGRPKHFYSIYRKMKAQDRTLDEIYDLFAMRIIVDTVGECYAVLGLVHQHYKPMPGRFKDYIAMPKPNMYQSLHTTVISSTGIPFEVQIRTKEMHRTAEYGIAAHWRYKEDRKSSSSKVDPIDVKLTWLRQLLEWQSDMRDASDFMNTLKEELITDEVYVFTPRGEVISLPTGSVPIDFAYHIHSGVGNSMYGAKVNGRMVPLTSKLENGDIVEILTSDKVKGPSLDWLNIVKSSTARTKISTWFKREMRDENIARGRETIDREIRKSGFTPAQLIKKEYYDNLLKRYSLNSLDDLYAIVGYGGLSAARIVPRLRDDYILSLTDDERADLGYRVTKSGHVQYAPQSIVSSDEGTWNKREKETKQQKKLASQSRGVQVRGIDNCLIRLSRCCNPVPGDKIIGYVTRGEGVTVHRLDCKNIKHLLDSFDQSPEDAERAARLIDVFWVEDLPEELKYQTILRVIARDRRNLLAEISSAVAEETIPILEFKVQSAKDISASIRITIETKDQAQVERLVKRLKAIPGVVDVSRTGV
ncbi:MAG TPA: bifunctional (p)ppGpp synthetase/guanosine-3',5'-bis(diphosphate) 3'-pyrophosphohydrolase [Clostridiaceae bacterium]|nr:bifunctional (p)ppGpp synthetase/guanosine-3',5'-bis(diphosphate) 3'-pyrophosphohydrolase [Clostridiaceae bacterium]